MLKILIVEDEPLFAQTLRHLVELNPRYRVTALADDSESAVDSAQVDRPDLALVDLQLARGSSGFSAAARLGDLGIACLFTSGKAPGFPLPDLALGCLLKPFDEDDLVCALKAAEDLLRGRSRWRPSRTAKLRLYASEQVRIEAQALPVRRSGRGVAARVSRWVRAHA